MSAKSDFLDQPPSDARLTDYDREHLATYLRLLDAESEGAPWEEAAQVIFGVDPKADHARALRLHESHLARAHWMRNNGFRELLKSSMH
ncbi:MAG: DUF2285 domain-containing protein [Rhizobiaceae bacterium]|nr:DUF2285 domain-containing protein [Rhizobiaceae bacterium]